MVGHSAKLVGYMRGLVGRFDRFVGDFSLCWRLPLFCRTLLRVGWTVRWMSVDEGWIGLVGVGGVTVTKSNPELF
ncbi:hypothetical protein HDC33_000410 [Sporosarcina sp. JAI121]|nr:hypothetical protein [Sporosarcina sp. JAI121]